jgi:aminopeptidase N
MRRWASQHEYGNVTTSQFIALAERESGQDLGHFFDVWLYQEAKPISW